MTKEQSVPTKILKVFSSEEISLQLYVLGKIIDLYFPVYKLAIEVNEKGFKGRKKDEDEKR